MLLRIPTISVVIPLYNKRAHIERALQSVFSQTLKPDEVIVVDDGSTDGGGEWVLQEYGSRVRYLRQPNGGVSRARNRGIAEASHDYVAFLDADDRWEPHFLEEIHLLIHRFPNATAFTTAYQLVVGDQDYVDPAVRRLALGGVRTLLDNFFEVCAHGDLPFHMSSLCMTKALLNELGGFPEGEPMGEDQDLFSKAALRGALAYSRRVSSFYHIDADNRACLHNIPEQECPFSQRLANLAERGELAPELRESILDYTAGHLLHVASLNIRAGNLSAARRLLEDDRCRRRWKRYLWWQTRYLLASMRERPAMAA
ncbi:MAG: glycosyltransferase family A protein [Pseudomonadota bacterium]|nr:glycosyltransferase family A protein [Pseudomonadota bacterium]